MFLKFLDCEEKELFIELANYLMKVDNEIAIEETEMINAFRNEMDMPEDVYKIKDESKDILFQKFCNINKANARKILIELFGLALADNNYDVKEKEMLVGLAGLISVNEIQINELIELIKDLKRIYLLMGKFISA